MITIKFTAETKQALVNVIRAVVREELASLQKNNGNVTEVYTDMKVVAISNQSHVTVEDMVTSRRLSDIPNKSGENVSVGDIVRVYETSGSFGNAYIGIKWS